MVHISRFRYPRTIDIVEHIPIRPFLTRSLHTCKPGFVHRPVRLKQGLRMIAHAVCKGQGTRKGIPYYRQEHAERATV